MLALFHKYSSCLFWPTQYLAVCPNGSCFTLNPPLPAGQLNTSVQVNNMATLHHIYAHNHTYLHHTYITIHFLLHTSSTPLGRPAGPDSSCLSQCISVVFLSWRRYTHPCQKRPEYLEVRLTVHLNLQNQACQVLNFVLPAVIENRE